MKRAHWVVLVSVLIITVVTTPVFAAEVPKPGPDKPAATHAGFVSLFNGRDFSGWRVPDGDNGHWKALDGVIDYDARSEAPDRMKDLWTEKEYGDFVLKLDWRIKETPATYPMPDVLPDGSNRLGPDGHPVLTDRLNADSGIYLRGSTKAQINIWCWPIGSGDIYGYRTDQAMPPDVRAGATPKERADNPVGEWNTFEVTLRGDRVSVVLNGRTVIDDTRLPGIPARGPIGLQHHGSFKDGKYNGASALMQFRNISIKELQASPPPVVGGLDEVSPVIVPQERIVLFNGRDLTGFYTWIGGQGCDDPDSVFTVVDDVDGAPAIRASGQHNGGIVTTKRYGNYRLVAEFRRGHATWEPRKDRARNSGIMLHCQGEDGSSTDDFRGPWMRSLECQVIEGGSGDAILVGGFQRGNPVRIVGSIKATVTPGTRKWNPDGVLEGFGPGRHRTDWRFKDPEWKDVAGFRGREDVEKPAGEWNRIEAVCDGASFAFFVNGVKVNEGRDLPMKDGPILFQSEGSEIFFRNIELHPLKPDTPATP